MKMSKIFRGKNNLELFGAGDWITVERLLKAKYDVSELMENGYFNVLAKDTTINKKFVRLQRKIYA